MWPTRRQILLSWEKWPNNLPPLPLPCLHTTVSFFYPGSGLVLSQGSRSRPREMISSFVNGTPHSPPLPPLSLMYTALGRPSFPMRYCNVHDAGHNLQGHFWNHISSLWKEKTFSYYGASQGRLNLRMRAIWPFPNFNGLYNCNSCQQLSQMLKAIHFNLSINTANHTFLSMPV